MEKIYYVHFFGSTGYCGTEYDEYEAVPARAISDDNVVRFFSEMCDDYSYENAQAYEYMVTGWGEGWENEEEESAYYTEAIENGSWEFCSKEEYDKFMNEVENFAENI